MKTLLEGITRMIDAIGQACSVLILLIMAIVVYEVVARYCFNAPTSWAWLVNKQLFGVFVMVAGGYALVHKSHIRIEMFYQHFPKALKTIIAWLTFVAACCFLGALTWKSWVMGLEAWETKEVAMGIFKLPLYPLKLLMPVVSLVFLVGCLAEVLRKK